jgi:hypothetical protein
LNKDGLASEQFNKMVLARAKIMLGHIRRKYQLIASFNPGTSVGNEEADIHVWFDGDALVEEGTESLNNCLDYLNTI